MRTKIDIKRAILERSYTVKTFAEKLGMTPVNLRENIIKGNPTVKKLEQVAEALGCDITDLFYPLEEETAQQGVDKEEVSTTSASASNDSPNQTPQADLFSPQSPADIDEHIIKAPASQDVMPVTTFCPHCGKKVRVGVVLLPEE